VAALALLATLFWLGIQRKTKKGKEKKKKKTRK
jgi:hypothetical protein